jgi:DNA-binding XRE family transcriptional regulator
MSCAEPLSAAMLRDVRTMRGFSVRALARVSGVSARTIRRVEEGQHRATTEVLQKLTEALARDDFHALALAEGIEPGTRAHLRDVLPWALDPCAQFAVARHPDGLTREQVADLLGICVRTVQMVEEAALSKLGRGSAGLRAFW